MFRNQQLTRLIKQSSIKPNQLRTSLVVTPQRNFQVRQKNKLPMFQRAADILNQEAENKDSNVFKHDTTLDLIKKLVIYKMMASNLFINHSLTAMSLSYRVLGIKLTNAVIENTAGSIFTGGVSVDDLCKDMDVLTQRNIGSISMMVAEGLKNADEKYLDYFHQVSKDTVMKMSEGRPEAHFATKLTVFVSLEVMERMSVAQKAFVHEILGLNYGDRSEESVLTREQLIENLANAGITEYSESDLDKLIMQCSSEGKMTPIARYKGGHLFNLFQSTSQLEKQIATKLGNMEDQDWKKYELFKERTLSFAEYAAERNTSLYVDAEQSYIQYAIESFGQQLTHEFNQGSQALIMNGYQCYTKRTQELLSMEVATAKQYGYNMGIKLIRGAYMLEERDLAQKGGYESPVFESIEDTHKCYNDNMSHIINNMTDRDMMLVASHNTESVDIATNLIDERDFKSNNRVVFGQLRGFSDQVTNQLAQDGYKVYKYVPFGPTQEVMPYLIRRGQESRQVLREQKFQNETLRAEIRQRILGF